MEGVKLEVKVEIKDSTGLKVSVPSARLLEMPLHPGEVGLLARKAAEVLADEIKTLDLGLAPDLFREVDEQPDVLRPIHALVEDFDLGDSIEIAVEGARYRIEKTKQGKVKTTILDESAA